MKQDQQNNDQSSLVTMDEDEIDLIGIVKTIWSGRITMFITIAVFTVIGVLSALSSPTEYTVSTIMVPQMTTGGKSQLSGLASLAGLDLGITQSSELSPIIYPKIVNSIPFKLELMNTPIHFSDVKEPITIMEYYTKYKKSSPMGIVKKYTLGLPGVILTAIRKKPEEKALPKDLRESKLIHLSADQRIIINRMSQMVSLDVEKKDGFLTLTVKMPEAIATAELAQNAQDLLQREIIKLKVEKSLAELNFIQERYNVLKAESEGYQVKVAANTDRFKNLTSNLPQVGTARIQTKFGIANSVFQELAKQLEQAKIQVKKDTPVFTVIEPVTIPTNRSKPNRPIILAMWMILGFMFGISIVYSKKVFYKLRYKWINYNN